MNKKKRNNKKTVPTSTKLFIRVEIKILIFGNIDIVLRGRINLKTLKANKFAEIPGNKLRSPVTTTIKSSQFQGSLRYE